MDRSRTNRERSQSQPVASDSPHARPRFIIADGTLEGLKWLGLVLMVADHINKYCYREQLPAVFAMGRIVMPIFGFVLAYNLTRPGALCRGVHGRIMRRLALVGVIATPICIELNAVLGVHHPWWPLNILFTLLLFVLLVFLIETGGWIRGAAATVLFLVGGTFVEYLWLGVLTCLGAWAFCRKPDSTRWCLWTIGTLSLTVINGNAWALLSIPIIHGASTIVLRLKRQPWMFYVAYPAHLLGVLVLMQVNH